MNPMVFSINSTNFLHILLNLYYAKDNSFCPKFVHLTCYDETIPWKLQIDAANLVLLKLPFVCCQGNWNPI